MIFCYPHKSVPIQSSSDGFLQGLFRLRLTSETACEGLLTELTEVGKLLLAYGANVAGCFRLPMP